MPWKVQEFLDELAVEPDRLAVAARFIAAWFRPLRPDDGMPAARLDAAEARLGRPLPRVLRRWYEMAGEERFHPLKMGGECVLVAPEQLSIEEGCLMFHYRYKEPMMWFLREEDLGRDDPEVLADSRLLAPASPSAVRHWVVENGSLSEFLLQMVIHETVFAAPQLHTAEGGSEIMEAVEQTCVALPFPAWHWPGFPTRLFALDDSVIRVGPGSVRIWPEDPEPPVVALAGSRTVEAAMALPTDVRLGWG